MVRHRKNVVLCHFYAINHQHRLMARTNNNDDNRHWTFAKTHTVINKKFETLDTLKISNLPKLNSNKKEPILFGYLKQEVFLTSEWMVHSIDIWNGKITTKKTSI